MCRRAGGNSHILVVNEHSRVAIIIVVPDLPFHGTRDDAGLVVEDGISGLPQVVIEASHSTHNSGCPPAGIEALFGGTVGKSSSAELAIL